MGGPRRLVLIACLALLGVVAAAASGADGPVYLDEFPPAERVMRNMARGLSDGPEAAARQAAAFEHLVRLIERIGRDRDGPDRTPSARERALVAEYAEAAGRLREAFADSERFAERFGADRASESFEQRAFEANFDGPWIAQWVDTTRARETMAALRAEQAAREPGFEATRLGRLLRAPDPRTAAARLIAIALLGLGAAVAIRRWRPVVLDPSDPLRLARGAGRDRFGVAAGPARSCDGEPTGGALPRFRLGEGGSDAGPFESRGAVVHAGDAVSCVCWPSDSGAEGVVFVINHTEGARFARLGPIRRLVGPSPWPIVLIAGAAGLGSGLAAGIVAGVAMAAVWLILRRRFTVRFALHEGDRLHEHLDHEASRAT